MKKLIKELLLYVKGWIINLIKKILHAIRVWLNTSKFVLFIIALSIGISFTACYYESRKINITWESKIVVYLNKDKKEEVIEKVEQTASEDAPVLTGSPIEKEIGQVFGKDAKIALAVFKTESGLNPNNVNWNCRYNGKSDICKPEDRGKAWSVDCGIAQINRAGKECPKELFDYKNNIRLAKQLFDKRGFRPWVSFNKEYYLANL